MLLAPVIQGQGQEALFFRLGAAFLAKVEVTPHPSLFEIRQEDLLTVTHQLVTGAQGLGGERRQLGPLLLTYLPAGWPTL